MSESLPVDRKLLPAGWVWTTLGDFCRLEAGGPAPQGEEHFRPGGHPFVRVQDLGRLGSQVWIHETKDSVTDGAASRLRLFPKGAVLFTKSGMSTLLNQRAILGRDMYVVSHIGVAIPDSPIPSAYVYYWLRTVDLGAMAHATTLPSLPLSKVRSVPIPLAPLPEQRRIVAAIEEQFSRIDAGVEALHRARRNLQRMRAAVLQAAVTGQLIPRDPEDEAAEVLLNQILEDGRLSLGARRRNEPVLVNGDLPSLPQGWCWATVDQLAAPEPHAITDGPFGSNLKTSHYTQAGPRVIRLQNIGDGVFVDERAHISPQHYEKLKKHAVAEGDVVIAALGEDLPRACTVPKWVTPAIVKADCIRFRPHRSLDERYLSLALNAPPTKARVAAIIHGVGRPRLNLTEIKSIILPLPPALEQRRIAVEASRYFSIIEAVEAQFGNMLARSEQLRRAVLTTAFDGDLVPQDPSDEAASVLLDRTKAVRAPQQSGHYLLPRVSRP